MSASLSPRLFASQMLALALGIACAAVSPAAIRTIDAGGESNQTPDAVVHLTVPAPTIDAAVSAPVGRPMALSLTTHVYGSHHAATAVYGANLVGPHLQPYGSTFASRGAPSPVSFGLSSLERAKPLWPIVDTLARQMGVDPALAMGVIETESAFRQQAVSPKGAVGLMQIMPGTARRLGVDARDPLDNLFGGVRYLSWLLQRYQGNEAFALAGYNAGEHAVDTWGGIPPYAETTQYVTRVLEAKRRWTLLAQTRL